MHEKQPSPALSARAALRKAIRTKRYALTPKEQDQAAQDVLMRFKNNDSVKAASSIALYWSLDGELNTQPLIDYCKDQGKRVYLPVIHPVCKGHLLFLYYDTPSCLVKNALGIWEPRVDIRNVLPCSQLDLICTPLVAFDHLGQRLGMGGGYYDRTFAPYFFTDPEKNLGVKNLSVKNGGIKKWNAKGPYPLGLAHDCQRVDTLPSEKWDIPLPEILTPSRHWIWSD